MEVILFISFVAISMAIMKAIAMKNVKAFNIIMLIAILLESAFRKLSYKSGYTECLLRSTISWIPPIIILILILKFIPSLKKEIRSFDIYGIWNKLFKQ